MRPLILLGMLLVCFASAATAQPDSLLIGKLEGYLIPLPWIDKNPRLRMGLEYHAVNHQSYSIELGYGNTWLNHNWLKRSLWGQEYSFFEIRPEVKWFVQHDRAFPWHGWWGKSLLPRYFAIEGFYQQMHDLLEDSDFNVKATEEDIAYDEARFKKIKIGIQGKLGYKVFLGKRVLMDIYYGIGLAYRKISYTHLVNPEPLTEQETWEWGFFEPYKNEGAYFLFQLSLGMRVGYVFGKL